MYSNNIIRCIYEAAGDELDNDSDDNFDSDDLFSAFGDAQIDLYLKNQVLFTDLTDEQKLEYYRIDISGIKPGEISGERLLKAFKTINTYVPSQWRRNIQRDVNLPVSLKVGSYQLLKNVPAYVFPYQVALSNRLIYPVILNELDALRKEIRFTMTKVYFFQKFSSTYNVYVTGNTTDGKVIGYSKRVYFSKALNQQITTSTIYGPTGTILLPYLLTRSVFNKINRRYQVNDLFYTDDKLKTETKEIIRGRLKKLGLLD